MASIAESGLTDSFLKENALRLVDHHTAFCDGSDCDVSLVGVRLLLQRAGIELDEEERAKLM